MSMIDDPRTKPLQEWNRLARENTENAIVASMFEASLRASPAIETFSSWLLVATAAVASFFIANVDNVLPLLSRSGFFVCGAFLCISCIFGLLSKMLALRCRISWETLSAVKQTFSAHLEDYKREEKNIKEGAAFWGINLETGIRIERVLKEFFLHYLSGLDGSLNATLRSTLGTLRLPTLFRSRRSRFKEWRAFFRRCASSVF